MMWARANLDERLRAAGRINVVRTGRASNVVMFSAARRRSPRRPVATRSVVAS
jgi:hypothetical protein